MLKPRATPWETGEGWMKAPTGRDDARRLSRPVGAWGVFPATIPRALPWALTLTHLGAQENAQLQNLRVGLTCSLRRRFDFLHFPAESELLEASTGFRRLQMFHEPLAQFGVCGVFADGDRLLRSGARDSLDG